MSQGTGEQDTGPGLISPNTTSPRISLWVDVLPSVGPCPASSVDFEGSLFAKGGIQHTDLTH